MRTNDPNGACGVASDAAGVVGLVGQPAGARYRRLRPGDQADGADARHQLLAQRRHVRASAARGTSTSAALPECPAALPRLRSASAAPRSPTSGYFVEMRSAAVALLPSAPARPSASCDIAGSWPTTSRVLRTSVASTPLISSMIAPGRRVVEPVDVTAPARRYRCAPGSAGCGSPSSTAPRRSAGRRRADAASHRPVRPPGRRAAPAAGRGRRPRPGSPTWRAAATPGCVVRRSSRVDPASTSHG